MVLQPAEGTRRHGTWCGMRFVPRAKKKTLPNAVYLLLEMGRSAGSGCAGPAVSTAVAGHHRCPEAAGTATYHVTYWRRLKGTPGK